jgi:hypothetical protein
MTIWTLHHANAIPGVSSSAHMGAGVAVEINDANEVVSVTPLASHSEFLPVSDAPAADDTVSDKAEAPVNEV